MDWRGNKILGYDNYGNTTSKGSNIKYGYTRGCLLTTFTNSSNNISLSFSYDYNGIRQSKTANNSNTHTFYYDNSNRLLLENTSEGLIEYIYSGNSLIGAIFNGRKFRYIKNILGDIIEIRNESGEIICEYSYDSFGNNELYDYTNSQSNIYDRKFVELNPFRYRGYYYDQESELYYLINRYYDPETHRFLTIDSFEYLDIESISGIDLYAYCGNNPVMYVDEGGNFPVQIEILASAITDFANLLSFGFKKTLEYMPELSMEVAKKMARNGGHTQSARSIIRARHNNIVKTQKLSEGAKKFSKYLGRAILVGDIIWTIGKNYSSGDQNWISDSIVDVGISAGIYALSCVPNVGWVFNIAAIVLNDVFNDEIEGFKDWFADEWKHFWSFEWAS